MLCDDVQLYLVLFCGLLLLLKQKLCPRMKTPAAYSINSITHPSCNHQKLEEQEDNQSSKYLDYLGQLTLVSKLNFIQEIFTVKSQKSS